MSKAEFPGRSRRVAIGGAMLALAGSLIALNAPVEATTFPGLNGRLVCVREVVGARNNLEVATFNPDGSELRLLTSDIEADFNPIWNPQGTKIVYETEQIPGDPDDVFELFIMNHDGSAKTPLLVNGIVDDRATAYHPDGSQIIGHANRGVGGTLEIEKLNAESGVTLLTNNAVLDANPDWSPDGTRIAFDSARTGNREIFTMDPFGGNLVQLTNFPGEDSGAEWSPDGSQIAFQRNINGNFEIMVMNADGTNVRNLTNHPARDTFAVWSPDGTLIAFTSYRDEPLPFGEVYVMNAADGSNVRRLTFTPGFDGRCDWQRICTIYGSGDIVGTEGNDVICGSEGPDRIDGRGGNDIISGFDGNDILLGGPGDDTMFGGLGNDDLWGDGGKDFSSAGPGNDRIIADPGERIDVGAGNDQCSVANQPTSCPPRLS